MERFNQITIIVLFVLLLISFGFNIWYNVKDKDVEIQEKVTVVEKVDTIRDTIPVVKYEKIVKYIHDTLNQTIVVHDTINDSIVERIDTIPVNVEIPISQKEYSDDSTYTAWVSGYKAQLDSINVYKKTIYVDREKIITKKDNKRFGIGPVIYGGYDFKNKQIGWGIGIGFTYHIWEF